MRRGLCGIVLTADANIAVVNFTMEHLATTHMEWLESRGIDSEIAARLGLYSDKQGQPGRVLIAPYVRNGAIINRKHRDTAEKKFWLEQGGALGFFNEDVLRDETLAEYPLVITEGEMDAIAAIQSGYPKAVSVPNGAESNLDFINDDLGGLKNEPVIILAVDRDEAGAKLGKRLLAMLGAVRCFYLCWPKDCKDLNDVVQKHGNDTVKAMLDGAKEYPVSGLYKLSSYPDIPAPKTFSTGWPEMDEGLRVWRSEFMVVTGVPGHGKSLWTSHLVANLAANHGHRCAIASFEMPTVPYVRDIFRNYHSGRQSIHHDWADADKWINERFAFIDPAPMGIADSDEDPTLEWLIDKAEAAVIRYGVDWLLVDPWNQISHEIGRSGSAEYQRQAIMKLKRFGRRYECGVIVVAHPTKDVKQPNGNVRQPNLYDIDGSSHWYNAADHGIVVDRDVTSNTVEIITKKSRHKSGGKQGSSTWLHYHETRGRYTACEAPSDYDNYPV